MAWQDIIGGAFSGLAGDPYGYQRMRQAREERQLYNLVTALSIREALERQRRQQRLEQTPWTELFEKYPTPLLQAGQPDITKIRPDISLEDLRYAIEAQKGLRGEPRYSSSAEGIYDIYTSEISHPAIGTLTRQEYQDPKTGEYREGFFDRSGNLVKDLGSAPATIQIIDGQAVSIPKTPSTPFSPIMRTEKTITETPTPPPITLPFSFTGIPSIRSDISAPVETEISQPLPGPRGIRTIPIPGLKPKENYQYIGVSDDKDKAPVVFDPDTGATYKNLAGKLIPYSGQVKPKVEKATATIITPGQTAQIAHSIRQEMKANPIINDYQEVVQKYNVMEKTLEVSKTTKNKVAIDQALITLFNKMTDPTSVVRESEYARTPENLSLINRIKGKAEQVIAGGAGLTDAERKAITDMGRIFYKAYEEEYKFTIDNYKRMAKESGINPNLISFPFERPVKTTTGIGDISEGVIYLKKARNRQEAKARMRALMQKGWTDEQLKEVERQAGY